MYSWGGGPPSPASGSPSDRAIRWLQTSKGFLLAAIVLGAILVADSGAMGYTVTSGGQGGSTVAYSAPDIPATNPSSTPTLTPGSTSSTAPSPTTPGTAPAKTPATLPTTPGTTPGTTPAKTPATTATTPGSTTSKGTGTSTTGPTTVTNALPPEGSPPSPMPASVVAAVTGIPTGEFNAIGVSFTPRPAGLHLLSGQPTFDVTGKPGILFMGDEWCPFCAVERWAIVAALSRFGTFSSLGSVTSSSKDVYPGTPSFSFDGSSYSSPYIGFEEIELASTQTDSQGQYLLLQSPNATEAAIIGHYDNSSVLGTGWNTGAVPFLDIDNTAIFAGSAFSPALLAGQSAQQVAAGLSNSSLTATRAIVASANVISAEICRATGQQPASVCSSPGVTAVTPTQGA